MIRNSLILALLLAPLSHAADPEKGAVRVENTVIRTKPSVFGSAVSKVPYGSVVDVLSRRDGWANVRFKEWSGWITESALGDTHSILRDVGKGADVSKKSYDSDVALAGKGFSEEEEKLYKKKNPKVDFKPVDRLEALQSDLGSIPAFALEGGLQNAGWGVAHE